jgi:O-antigen/teichoic acid export membrane protein
MKRTVLKGVAWVGGAMFAVRSVRYVALFLLGGLLTPSDFGLFFAIFIIIDGLALLQGLGIGHALVYRQDETDEAADTSFLLSVGIGVVLIVIAWLAAPQIGRFYSEEAMTDLFRVGSIILLLHAFRMVPFRLFEKALDFRQKLLPALVGSLAYLTVSLFLAFRGAGAWALLGGEIASVLFETVSYWIISPWRPRLRFNVRLAKQNLAFGWTVIGGSALIFAFRNADRLTLSRLLGAHSLGLYVFAYAIANLPATLLVRILNTVLFPTYSSLGDDRAAQRTLFLRATSYMAGAGLLYALGLASLGRPLLVALYAGKWEGAVVPLALLGVFALFRALSALVGDLLIGTGRPSVFRAICGLQLVVAVVGLYPAASRWGVVGVAYVMTAAAAAALAVGWPAAASILGIGWSDMLRALRAPVVTSVIVLAPAWGLARVLSGGAGTWTVIGAAVLLGSVFVSIWVVSDRELRGEWRRLCSHSGLLGRAPGDGGKA